MWLAIFSLKFSMWLLSITDRRENLFTPVGYPAKTYQIDARVLLQMAKVINQHPEREKYIRPLPDVHRQLLAAMVVRRRQLTIILTAERNRLHPSHPQNNEVSDLLFR